LAGRASREDLDALFDFCDGPNVEFSGGDGFQNIFASIRSSTLDSGIMTPCVPVSPLIRQTSKIFDLFVDAADGLNISC